MATAWRDVTLPLEESTPPYPGDPGLSVQTLMNYERGDGLRLSAISLSAHLGTHVDAPLHFVRTGKSIEQIPLEVLIGPAQVIEVLTSGGINGEQLARRLPPSCERLLIKTSQNKQLAPRPTAWLEPEAARFLVEKGVRLLGIDSPSVDSLDAEPARAHQILLEKEIVIVENLALQAVSAGACDMICLPLKLAGLEGAPARVVLRKKE
jgi:arylformamidase